MLECRKSNSTNTISMDRAYMSLRARKPPKTTMSEQSSPFRRWTSGVGAGSLTHRSYRRPGSLLSNTEHDMYPKCVGGQRDSSPGGGVASWSLGLEQLLADPAGAAAFAAYLAREFSAENIKFWWACEKYKNACSPSLAKEIWQRHLAEGAPEPVNVDSAARQQARERLDAAPPDLFAQAQKQIFSLMKFDSYPRFLRSDVHAECARAELRGAPLPYAPASPTHTPTKLKKSLSNADERRRGSILPWSRLRNGSKERSNASTPAPQNPPQQTSNPQGPQKQQERRDSEVSETLANGCQLCRVVLPDGASSVVSVDGHSSVRHLVDKLLDKRAIRCLAYDVVIDHIDKDKEPLDVSAPASSLAGRQVRVERRIVLRMELGARSVTVRCRPDKRLLDVLRPVLARYKHTHATVRVMSARAPVALDTATQELDGQRLQVILEPPMELLQPGPCKAGVSVISGVPAVSGAPGIPGVSVATGAPCRSLDELTNRVFEEVLKGKHELKVPQTASMKSDSTERIGRARTPDSEASGGAPVVARLHPGVPLHTALTEAQEPSEQKQAQRLRLPLTCDARPTPATRNLTKPSPAVRTSITNKLSPSEEKQNYFLQRNSPIEEKHCQFPAKTSPIDEKNCQFLLKSSPIEEKNCQFMSNENCQFMSITTPVQEKICNFPSKHSPTDEKNCQFTSKHSPIAEKKYLESDIDKRSNSSDSDVTLPRVDPPPLPPKPKVIPARPPNWGNLGDTQEVNLPVTVIEELKMRNKRLVYLDQPTSSFV